MPDLPSGTVTFLFTDIEGATRLLQRAGDRYGELLATHRELLREAFEHHGGHEMGTEGDSFFVAFERASSALAAAIEGQSALGSHPWGDEPVRVRMGIHTGEAHPTDGGYIGLAVHEAARIKDAAHGGQVLVSQTTRDLLVSRLPGNVTLRDLGEHKLKDIAEPGRLFQPIVEGLAAAFPPLRALSVLPNNLPSQLSSFVGREEVLDEIAGLRRDARLMTLTGAGGCGKTRLAIETAIRELEHREHGSWFWDLASITDGRVLWNSLGQVFRIGEDTTVAMQDAVTDYLRERDLLLVVDNCEHLLNETVATVKHLLSSCPSIALLATSREPLGLAGEIVYRVPSMGLPAEDEDASGAEAVQLFADRAALAGGFALTEQNASAVTDICRHLDGMPLAIELAASRCRVMTPEEIASRLDNRFALLTGGTGTGLRRQQTLRAAVDWSYELLSDAERTLFKRLSVFAGGFTLEGAEEVCGSDPLQQGAILDLLTSLVDRSLVVTESFAGKTRYRLLETMREYAREALVASGEASQMWDRHLDHYSTLGERAETPLRGGPEKYTWMRTFDEEIDNVRQALGWAKTGGDAERGVRLAGCLYFWWIDRGHLRESRLWLDELMELARSASDVVRATGCVALSSILWRLGENGPASAMAAECMALERTPDTERWIAEATTGSARVRFFDGDPIGSLTLLSDALEMQKRIGDRHGEAETISMMRWVKNASGDEEAGRQLRDQEAAIYRELGEAQRLGDVAAQISYEEAVRSFGNVAEARAAADQAVQRWRESGNRPNVANALLSLADVERRVGDYQKAQRLVDEALSTYREIGHKFGVYQTLHLDADLATDTGDYEKAYRQLAEALDIAKLTGLTQFVGAVHSRVGLLHLNAGRTAEARSELEKLRAITHGIEFELWQIDGDYQLALVDMQEGNLAVARPPIERAAATAGLRNPFAFINAAHIDFLEGRYEDAMARLRTGLEDVDPFYPSPMWVAVALLRIGIIVSPLLPERACQLFGAATAKAEGIGPIPQPRFRELYDRTVAGLRAKLGDEAFDWEWSKGVEVSNDDFTQLVRHLRTS